MADLFSLLGLGAGALSAQNAGAAVAANNTANANTVGYARETVDLESLLAAPLVGGVRAGDAQRVASNLLANRQRLAGGQNGKSQAFAAATAELSGSISGDPPVDAQLALLFSAIAKVAAAPQDSALRTAAVSAARSVTGSFNDKAAAIAQSRLDADGRIRDDAAQATQLAAQVASLDGAVATSNDPTLRDKRDLAAQQLATLVGGAARIDGDGHMRVVLDGGGVLVDGPIAAQLKTTPDPVTGYARLQLVDRGTTRDVTSEIASGAIGGELQVRDVTGAQAASDLDQLAYDTATSLNAVHAANAGLDGVTGRNLFAPPAAVVGAAAAMTIDPTVAADPSKLAAAAAGAGPGDSSGAMALLAVKDAAVASGGTRTLGDAAIELASSNGAVAQTAQGDADRDSTVVDHLGALRDSLSGVDTNEELAKLTKFQNAAGAMTRFISTIDSMLGDLLQQL